MTWKLLINFETIRRDRNNPRDFVDWYIESNLLVRLYFFLTGKMFIRIINVEKRIREDENTTDSRRT